MTIQQILDERFSTYDELIAKYQYDWLLIPVWSQPIEHGDRCNVSKIKLVAKEFANSEGQHWWQFVSEGEC